MNQGSQTKGATGEKAVMLELDSQTPENWKPLICMLYFIKYAAFWLKV